MRILFYSLATVPIMEIGRFVSWWYGAGRTQMLRWVGREWRELEDHIHWKQWARALFVPMYGQNDWKGRIVSVVMRSVVLVYKTLWVGVWFLFHVLILATYILFPLVAVGMTGKSIVAIFNS